MIVGHGAPGSISAVLALNCLQNSMMLMPRWPSAGPTGGDGFACPAGTCNFILPASFLAMWPLLSQRPPDASGGLRLTWSGPAVATASPPTEDAAQGDRRAAYITRGAMTSGLRG